MTTLKAFAPAKINLTLHVTGQREDGYHLLDSLVAFAQVGDALEFHPGPALSLEVTGKFARGVPVDRANLVWRAAELAGWTGHITLDKDLPHGGGIGGGSADAAATLRALGGTERALELGADVPVCVIARASRMRGIGEDVQQLPKNPPLWAVLVNPGVEVPTPQVFARLATKSNPPMEPFPDTHASPEIWLDWLARQRNDLQAPAISIAPRIGDVVDTLEAHSQVRLARMSGSGSTCFGVCINAHAARQVQREIAATHPDWWCAVTSLG